MYEKVYLTVCESEEIGDLKVYILGLEVASAFGDPGFLFRFLCLSILHHSYLATFLYRKKLFAFTSLTEKKKKEVWQITILHKLRFLAAPL